LLAQIEQARLRISKNTAPKKKSQLGQFLTPKSTASFMAGLFSNMDVKDCHLLDPGAGMGSLACAFIDRCITDKVQFGTFKITAFELDNDIQDELANSLSIYKDLLPFTHEIFGQDFIEETINQIQFGQIDYYSHAIINPPYKKIGSDSRYRQLLRQAGIETVNLYSAFVALALCVLREKGQLVAIIPRSFCNGPYYRPFRDIILANTSIKHIHLFESRNAAFKDDGVLQENIIILLERGSEQGKVVVSTSTDDSFSDLEVQGYPFDQIVFPDDAEHFIHVPTPGNDRIDKRSKQFCHSLEDIGVNVSTGPVVDFRLKEHLRDLPEPGTVPLLYPGHFCNQKVEWPKTDLKKPNAIQRNDETEKWLFPTGYYCVVRRFSSKEERRRIVASLVQPNDIAQAEAIGFENHLNILHNNKQGLPESLALGLVIYLNSTVVDESFRRFSGHTQVNAADLKLIKYPGRTELMALGKSAGSVPLDQKAIDDLVEGINAV
jgi:adenine-specific DNA-methyltransferase